MKGEKQKQNVAMAALESLTCSMVFYLKTLGEIEENPGYKRKISLIIVIFFHGNESDLIKEIKINAEIN